MTLTQTAIIVKQLIFFSIIFLILAIFGFIGYQFWVNLNLSKIPPPEEKPNLLFGKLPAPNFPKVGTAGSNFTYSIDTVTGNLPKLGEDPGFDKIIKVFFIPKPYATLLAPDRSKDLAENLNILTEPQILSETEYRYEDLGKILTVNLDSGNFTYINNNVQTETRSLDSDEKLIADFKGILQRMGVFKGKLGGKSRVTVLQNQGDNATPSAMISLWQDPVDKREIYTPKFNQALVVAEIYGSTQELGNYLSLNYTFWQIDETTFATYLTKSPQQAFEDLKNGLGVVIIEPEKPHISITSVSLGYFLSDQYTSYLLPIYVFEGPHFVSYVWAINEQ